MKTGNPMINGLLSSKLKEAASQQIQFNINMDLCTIIASRDTFLTSKPDKKQHGLGLISIRYTVGKYDGTVTTTVDEDHYFILAISIPIANPARKK